MEQLFTAFRKPFGLSYDGANEHVRSILSREVHEKESLMVRAGQINRRIYYIESGLVRHFVAGLTKEVTSWVLPENNFAVIPASFFHAVPSQENMQALERTVTWSITYSELKDTIARFPKFADHENRIYHYYRELKERIDLELGLRGPIERYLWLLENQPEVAARASQSVICSYLNISLTKLHEARDRVRKKLK